MVPNVAGKSSDNFRKFPAGRGELSEANGFGGNGAAQASEIRRLPRQRADDVYEVCAVAGDAQRQRKHLRDFVRSGCNFACAGGDAEGRFAARMDSHQSG